MLGVCRVSQLGTKQMPLWAKIVNKLQKFRQDLKKKGKGFTLVELIVVIIIIAIIAAVAIPAITSFQDNARKSRIQSEHRELISAVQSYIGSQDDPDNVTIDNINVLAPYIAKNSKGEADLTKTLAKNGNDIAHKIDKDNHKLISTFTPSGGGKEQTWEYDWKSKS